MRRSIVLAITLVAMPVLAQQPARTISPGMSRAQVVAALGEPIAARDMSDFTYVFYKNDCGKQCGMNDIVVLHGDSVVDAIFRSPARRYTGKSSSPEAIPPRVAARKGESPEKATSDTGTKKRRMKPGPANDTRPSIPLHPPTVKPAAKQAAPPPAPKAAAQTTKPTKKTP